MKDHPALVPLTRRRFLEAGAISAVASVLPGCGDPPPERIVPFVERPLELTPGVSRYYATAALRAGVAVGLRAASRDGRPIKIEGNPHHPSSLGATGPVEQALSYTLYDTDRLASLTHRGAPTSFAAFARAARALADERLHLWLPPMSSPLVAALLDQLRARHPSARIHFDPSGVPAAEWAATRAALGRPLALQYRFADADRVLALDADVLSREPGSIRWAREWASRRQPGPTMSRCYAVDSSPTPTSAGFDHRLAIRASEIGRVAAGLLGALDPAHARWLEEAPERAWIEAVARDLVPGRTIVVAGEAQPAYVHVLALAINAALGSFGATITPTRSPWLYAGEDAFDPATLLDALDAGEVGTLLIAGTNPAYTLSSLGFAERARRAKERVVLSQYPSETTRLASWLVPELHPLERWGDALGHDGTRTTIQPLMRPLFGGQPLERVLLALAGEPDRDTRDLLEHALGSEADAILARGFVEGSAFPAEQVGLSPAALPAALDALARATRTRERAYELELRPDPRIGDGAHAENAWLEELPETMTKLVWDNAALMAPADVARLGLAEGELIELVTEAGAVTLPVAPLEGQARGTIVAWRGFGRQEGGRSARGVGVDVGRLTMAPWIAAEVRPTGRHYRLARTQQRLELPPESVPIALRTTLAELERHPDFAAHHDEDPPSLHPERLSGSPQWGMAVDLSLCTGCQSCVIACQVENNTPVVGKTQVALGREMHWLRIDRYVQRSAGGEARTTLQPMACVHCEKAPCEYVCPVNATVHSPDGLNEMVYNRCVGTRFCSNNCPYKVRRFNWYDFHAGQTEPETMVFNPDVTVRERGVMEKCTYCVQRIRRAGIDARRERRARDVQGGNPDGDRGARRGPAVVRDDEAMQSIVEEARAADGPRPARETRQDFRRAHPDGEVVTACAEACPTGAIVFGDVSDRQSRVARLHADPRTYAALNELGTRPRTRYLARIDNENPELSER